MFSKLAIFVLPALLFYSTSVSGQNSSYIKSIEKWHAERLESLMKADGWLSLTGLFWLKQGKNSFGGGRHNDIIFPGKDIPENIGVITWTESQLSAEFNTEVLVDGSPAKRAVLKTDAEGRPTKMSLGSLLWYVIRRGDQYGIRLKDSQSTTRLNFKGIERYPVNKKWKVEAVLQPYETPAKLAVPTVLGTTITPESAGRLQFLIGGKPFFLDPIGTFDDDEWFIIFGDETNGDETYGGGRFLDIAKPDSSGKTIIDFNKAYNPPCVFTEFATCPLPPIQNRMKVLVTAGEKNYEGATH